jgi:hypothetical protein
MVWIVQVDIIYKLVGSTQGEIAQWLEHLVHFWGGGEGLGSNPRWVTFLTHTRNNATVTVTVTITSGDPTECERGLP